MVKRSIDRKLFKEAKKYIPGGVNSPVRSFKNIGSYPVFMKAGKGAKIYSEQGKKFIDYCLSWGALILGHAKSQVVKAVKKTAESGLSFGTATRLETELSKRLIEAFPSMRQVRLTNSGTEAVMGAIRLARGYTRKKKIIKFGGSYHGHADYLLARSGSGIATLGVSGSLGVPDDFAKHTIVLPYNNTGAVKKAVSKYQKDLAAVIVEPVMANCGVIVPKDGFLEELRKVCDRFNLVLIFDEVITGFRLSYGGAQEFFKVRADLTCLGKIIGGGLPLGAFGGRREIMKILAPLGGVYQAGTLSGNPLVVSAALATLNLLKKENPYFFLQQRTRELCEGIKTRSEKFKIKVKVNYLSSLFSIFFTNREVRDYESSKHQNKYIFKKFYHKLLEKGIYFSPSHFEANFLSSVHSSKLIAKTLDIIEETFKEIKP